METYYKGVTMEINWKIQMEKFAMGVVTQLTITLAIIALIFTVIAAI